MGPSTDCERDSDADSSAKVDTVTFTLTLLHRLSPAGRHARPLLAQMQGQAPPPWIPGQASPPRASQMQSVSFLRPLGPLLAVDPCCLAGCGHS